MNVARRTGLAQNRNVARPSDQSSSEKRRASEKEPVGPASGSWTDLEPKGTGPGSVSCDETNWWVIRRAGQPGLPEAQAARSLLCRTYWRPVYSYIRQCGQGHEDAQDLTQEFLCRLLEKNYVKSADRDKGRFRSYLLMMLKRFLADQGDRSRRQKRGGGVQTISLQEGDTDFRTRHEPVDDRTPDVLCDRHWAETMLEQALEHLGQEGTAAGKEPVFLLLKRFLLCDAEGDCVAASGRRDSVFQPSLKSSL